LVSVQQGRAQFNLPAPAREILRADETDLVYYQVLGLRGEYLSGERELPLPPEDDVAETGRVKLRDEMFRGEEVRIAWLYTRAEPTIGSLKPDSKPILIQVAETRSLWCCPWRCFWCGWLWPAGSGPCISSKSAFVRAARMI
jgi:two-component system, OmpR family, sensor histidine kinase TctE